MHYLKIINMLLVLPKKYFTRTIASPCAMDKEKYIDLNDPLPPSPNSFKKGNNSFRIK